MSAGFVFFFWGGGDISDIDKYNFNSDFSLQIFCPGFGESIICLYCFRRQVAEDKEIQRQAANRLLMSIGQSVMQ